MKKHICFIVQEYFPKDPRVRKYVNLLLENCYSVDVISLKRFDLPCYENYKNLEIYRIGLPKKRASLYRYFIEYLFFFFSSFVLVTKLYIKKKYSIIHINTLPDFLVFSTIIPKFFGAKILLDMHEIAPEFFQMKFNKTENHLIIRLLKSIEKVSLVYCDFAITVTKAIREIFIKRAINEKKIDVIMNVPIISGNNLKKKINYKKRFNIVYHGTITDLYSLENAVDAVSLIKNKISHIKFHIFGEGPSESRLKKRVNEKALRKYVIFHGYVKSDQMNKELEKMDVGMLPMKRNIFIDLSFSNKLAEYVNLGISVLTTRIPAVQDYFSDDSLFYSDDKPYDIEKTLFQIYSNENIAREKLLNSYKEYKKINWEIMSARYLAIIQQLEKE